MNKKFAKLIDNDTLEYAPNPCIIVTHHHEEWTDEETGEKHVEDWDERKKVYSPTAEQYLSAEGGPYKRIADNRIPQLDDYNIVEDGWDEQDTELIPLYRYEPIPVTQADYDAAMEDHIRQAREERGYTTREPSEYISSSVPRWAQDAADFVRFRDAVMLVGLRVINEYAQTGVAPTLAEFRAMLPKCEWTYTEEA